MSAVFSYNVQQLAEQLKNAIETYYAQPGIIKDAKIINLCQQKPLNYFKLLRACFIKLRALENNNLYSLLISKNCFENLSPNPVPFPYVGFLMAQVEEQELEGLPDDFTEEEMSQWSRAKFSNKEQLKLLSNDLIDLIFEKPYTQAKKTLIYGIQSTENGWALLRLCFDSQDRQFLENLYALRLGLLFPDNAELIINSEFIKETESIRQKAFTSILAWYSSDKASEELKINCRSFIAEFAKVDAAMGKNQIIDLTTFCQSFERIKALVPAEERKMGQTLDTTDKVILATLIVLGIALVILSFAILPLLIMYGSPAVALISEGVVVSGALGIVIPICAGFFTAFWAGTELGQNSMDEAFNAELKNKPTVVEAAQSEIVDPLKEKVQQFSVKFFQSHATENGTGQTACVTTQVSY